MPKKVKTFATRPGDQSLSPETRAMEGGQTHYVSTTPQMHFGTHTYK